MLDFDLNPQMTQKNPKQTSFLLCTLLAALFLSSNSAYAYLDPGTGTIIIQGLIAAVVGGAVAIKMYWFKVKGFFSKKTKQQADEPDSNKE
jgi:uncharacterized membrane-anchored protein